MKIAMISERKSKKKKPDTVRQPVIRKKKEDTPHGSVLCTVQARLYLRIRLARVIFAPYTGFPTADCFVRRSALIVPANLFAEFIPE